MGWRFRRTVRIAPGLKVNATKSGLSVTAGGKGASYTVHSSGRETVTYGIPGTGIHHTETHAPAQSRPSQGTPAEITPARVAKSAKGARNPPPAATCGSLTRRWAARTGAFSVVLGQHAETLLVSSGGTLNLLSVEDGSVVAQVRSALAPHEIVGGQWQYNGDGVALGMVTGSPRSDFVVVDLVSGSVRRSSDFPNLDLGGGMTGARVDELYDLSGGWLGCTVARDTAFTPDTVVMVGPDGSVGSVPVGRVYRPMRGDGALYDLVPGPYGAARFSPLSQPSRWLVVAPGAAGTFTVLESEEGHRVPLVTGRYGVWSGPGEEVILWDIADDDIVWETQTSSQGGAGASARMAGGRLFVRSGARNAVLELDLVTGQEIAEVPRSEKMEDVVAVAGSFWMHSVNGLRRLGDDLTEVERVPLASDPLARGKGQADAPMPAWAVTSGFVTSRNTADTMDTVEFWSP